MQGAEQELTERGSHRHWRGSPEVVALGGALASAGLEYVFPLATHVALTSVCFELTTAAGGGNRQAVLRLEDGLGATVYAVAAPAVQAGGLTVVYSFGNLVTAFGSAALGFMGAPLPGGELPENLKLIASVGAAAGADLIADGRMLVRQWATR